jgi:hypothetical protein
LRNFLATARAKFPGNYKRQKQFVDDEVKKWREVNSMPAE